MWPTIGAVVTALASLLVWWLNRSKQRERAAWLAEKREIENGLAQTLADGDTVGHARWRTRLFDFSEKTGHPL